MALKHFVKEQAQNHQGKVMTLKEVNRLKHALNSNSAAAVTWTAVAITALTFIARRSRSVVISPTYNDAGELTGATHRITDVSNAEAATEQTHINMAATQLGRGTVIMIQEQQREFEERLHHERLNFETRMATNQMD